MAEQFKKKCNILTCVEEPQLWNGKDGYKGASAKVVLDTGESAEYSSTPQWVQGHIDALKKLVGQEIELLVEDKGQYGYKIVDYPGKPTGSGSGKAKVNPRIYAAQTALLAAAQTGLEPPQVIEIAEKFYMPWLLKAGESSDAGAASTSAPPPSDPVVDRGTDGKAPRATASLPQIRALRKLAEQKGWSEEEACERAGVSYLGEITAEQAPKLIAAWNEAS